MSRCPWGLRRNFCSRWEIVAMGPTVTNHSVEYLYVRFVRVLICPGKFAGTLSAPEAAAAIAEGWREAVPADVMVERPVADGGPGFVEVLAQTLSGTRLPVS